MIRTLALAAVLAAFTVASAQADCRDDLVKADQNFAKTRSALQAAASAAPAVKCAAYRRHVASLTEVRNVFARCDTSAGKAKNAAQTNAALASFSKQAREACPQPAAKGANAPAAKASGATAPAAKGPGLAPPPGNAPLPPPKK
jgi:hypothetical protein